MLKPQPTFPGASLSAVALVTGMLTPAHAHSGQHAHMTLLELAAHYAEPDHLAFLALIVIVGCIAYRLGRKIEARQAARSSNTEKSRS